jgi:hypothetical protein
MLYQRIQKKNLLTVLTFFLFIGIYSPVWSLNVGNCWVLDVGNQKLLQTSVLIKVSSNTMGKVTDIELVHSVGPDQKGGFRAARRAILRCQKSGYPDLIGGNTAFVSFLPKAGGDKTVKKIFDKKIYEVTVNYLSQYINQLPLSTRITMQQILTLEGMYTSSIDGIFGINTYKGLEKFIYLEPRKFKINNSFPFCKGCAQQVVEYFENITFDQYKEDKKNKEITERRKEQERKLAEQERKRADKLAEQERKLAEQERKLAEQEKKRTDKLARENLDLKLIQFHQERKLKIEKNLGFRDLKPLMSSHEASRECGNTIPIDVSGNAVKCYGLENLKFSARYRKHTVFSDRFGLSVETASINLMSTLTVDLGPISQSLFSELLTYYESDPDEGNIFAKMYRNFKKYEMDFQFSKRDLELYNENEKSELLIVYENGKVALRISKVESDYRTRNNLFVEYRDASSGQGFLKLNQPKRATSDDF